MGVIVVRVVPSTERVKARKGEGRGLPTVFISNVVVSIPFSESVSVTDIGVDWGTANVQWNKQQITPQMKQMFAVREREVSEVRMFVSCSELN